ncbi:hypothetical protein ACKU07_25080 [Enterobacter hormaechei]
MEVEMWDGGLQEQEVVAIEKIKAAFSDNVSKPDKPVRGGSIGEQLQSYGYTGNGMFRKVMQVFVLLEKKRR